jgi:hypothetical protein
LTLKKNTTIEDVKEQLGYFEGKIKSELKKGRMMSGLRTDSNSLLCFSG